MYNVMYLYGYGDVSEDGTCWGKLEGRTHTATVSAPGPALLGFSERNGNKKGCRSHGRRGHVDEGVTWLKNDMS